MRMIQKTHDLKDKISLERGYREGEFIQDREGRVYLLCEGLGERIEHGVSVETWIAVYFKDVAGGYTFELKEIEAVLEYAEYDEVLEVNNLEKDAYKVRKAMDVLQGFLIDIRSMELIEDGYWGMVTEVWGYLPDEYITFEKERGLSSVELTSELIDGIKLGMEIELGAYGGVYITNVLIDLEDIGLGQSYLTEDLITIDERMVDIYEGEDLTDEEYDEKEYFILESYVDTLSEEDIIEHIKRGLKEQE